MNVTPTTDALFNKAGPLLESDLLKLCRIFEMALRDAKETIKTLHNIGVPHNIRDELWSIYEKNAPEMKRLNAALGDSHEPDK